MPATIYIGKPGSGKSTLMRGHIASIAEAPGDSVILGVDHGEKPGAPTWRDLANVRIYRSIAEWYHEPSRVAFFQGVPGRDVAQLAIDVGWSFYVDDECDDVVADRWKDSPLREIIKRGRHLTNKAGEVTSVQCFLATHRPANLPTDIVGCFDRVYIGRLDSFNDCSRIYDETWIANATNPRDVQAALRPLAPDDPNAQGERGFLWYP
jgi:hypothetical protein